MVSLIFVLSLLSLSGKGQAMTHFPLNAAVVVGQTVTFNCRTESLKSVWWKYKAVGFRTDCLLFNRKILEECGCDNCNVNKTEPGQYDLQITNTRQSDAGSYICVDNKEPDANVSKADYHSAELIVLASAPECGTNLTGSEASLLNDSVWMWCVVYFRGNIAPVMEWRNKANNEIISSLNNNHRNRQVESEIIIQLKHDDNRGIVYSCTTYFNQSFPPAHGSIDSAAKNAPDYTYTWRSQNDSYWTKHHTPTRSELTSARPHAEETAARNCRETVIGLGTSVVILATSTLAFFVGCLIAVKRIRKAKKERHLSSKIDASQNVRTAAEYEEVHETAQQSLGLPVYQNVPALQTGYMELEIIDQQPQQPRNYTTLQSLH